MKRLWYSEAAKDFHSALPIGNGRLGGMVYGGTALEKISLNEDTLWSGYPKDKTAKDAYEGLKQAEEALAAGDVSGAENLLWEKALSDWTEGYQPAGNLLIKTDTVGEVSDYYRGLSLETAIADTSFKQGGDTFRREIFCSEPADVMAISQKSSAANPRSEISIECPHKHRFAERGDALILEALSPSYCAPNYFKCDNPIVYDEFENNRALTYSIVVKPVLNGGSYEIKDDKLVITSNDFTLFLAIATNFDGFDKQPIDSNIDHVRLCLYAVEKAAKQGLEELKAEHIADYKSLFDRVEFSLSGENRDDLPTNERLLKYQEDNADNGLAVLMFDYGRYLTIAASREHTQPTNLQGLWNEEIRAPWSSNYTININTQMNYWHAEACGLSECHMPLMEMIKELAEKGAATAQNNYKCRGWCSHHNTDLWRQSEPVGGDNPDSSSIGYGFWHGSGAWLSRHIWEHYEYTKDKDFLSEYWQVLKGAGMFMLDRLIETSDGKLVTPMSTSPENSYFLDGKPHALSIGCAMDIGIAVDIFTACIKAAGELEVDAEFVAELETALKKLSYYKTGSEGQLLEWNEELQSTEPQHRHLSLLYGLYPGKSINDSTPEWISAAEKTMRLRGDEATGWGIAWKINVWARLNNGEKAKICLDKALRPVSDCDFNYSSGGGLYPNMLGAHPPFQIDSNYGVTAGIVEMLVQNTGDDTGTLRALPKEWQSGKLSGIRVHGGKFVNVEWEKGTSTITFGNIE